MKPEILINPLVRWAVLAADQGRITYVPGSADTGTLPYENECITRPFLVDPLTGQPVRVRVVAIQREWHQGRHILSVVVAREQ
jgi:hypothetical protein